MFFNPLFMGENLEPPSITYRGENDSGLDTSGYTFSFGIGSADPTRLVVVGVFTQGSVPSSVSIAGGGGAIHASTSSGVYKVALVSRVVPTGATASIGVSYGSNQETCGVGCWTITGLKRPSAPHHILSSSDGAYNSKTLNLNYTRNSVGIIVGIRSHSTAVTTTGATENFDVNHGTTGSTGSRAIGAYRFGSDYMTISTTMASVMGIAGATWR